MRDHGDDRDARTEDAVLVGGPADLPEHRRACRVDDAISKVKVRYLGGHEHFERTDERVNSAAGVARVYRWSMRTKVAE
jgi:hypothetical protein